MRKPLLNAVLVAGCLLLLLHALRASGVGLGIDVQRSTGRVIAQPRIGQPQQVDSSPPTGRNVIAYTSYVNVGVEFEINSEGDARKAIAWERLPLSDARVNEFVRDKQPGDDIAVYSLHSSPRTYYLTKRAAVRSVSGGWIFATGIVAIVLGVLPRLHFRKQGEPRQHRRKQVARSTPPMSKADSQP